MNITKKTLFDTFYYMCRRSMICYSKNDGILRENKIYELRVVGGEDLDAGWDMSLSDMKEFVNKGLIQERYMCKDTDTHYVYKFSLTKKGICVLELKDL